MRNSKEVCQYLMDWLPREIPISEAFGLVPLAWENETLKLLVPLEKNRNHMHSGFGGSLYTSALLVGWSWLHLKLKALGYDKNFHIVIQQANISYPLPVLEDSIAYCGGVALEDWQKFLKIFERKGKGRLHIATQILVNDAVATEFSGDFVVYQSEK